MSQHVTSEDKSALAAGTNRGRTREPRKHDKRLRAEMIAGIAGCVSYPPVRQCPGTYSSPPASLKRRSFCVIIYIEARVSRRTDQNEGGEVVTQLIRATCPYCKSSGMITAPPPQTILMGPCPACGEPVALFNGRVIGLKEKIFREIDSVDKIQSLAKTIVEYINSQIADEGGEAANAGDSPISDPEVEPSIRNPVASPITAEEVEDFLKIDLNLLGKKDFFDRHFG